MRKAKAEVKPERNEKIKKKVTEFLESVQATDIQVLIAPNFHAWFADTIEVWFKFEGKKRAIQILFDFEYPVSRVTYAIRKAFNKYFWGKR